MQRAVAALLVATFAMAPLGAMAADLVVWWEEGYYDQEDEAVGEIIAAFQQKTGKQVELVLLDEEKHVGAIVAALDAEQPPDFCFGTLMSAYVSE
jgi:ABC-type glycerol-3-phosphate transport system substrate-binding protein